MSKYCAKEMQLKIVSCLLAQREARQKCFLLRSLQTEKQKPVPA